MIQYYHDRYFAGTQSVQFKMEDGLKLSYDYSTTNLISPTDPIGTSQLNAVWCLSPVRLIHINMIIGGGGFKCDVFSNDTLRPDTMIATNYD